MWENTSIISSEEHLSLGDLLTRHAAKRVGSGLHSCTAHHEYRPPFRRPTFRIASHGAPKLRVHVDRSKGRMPMGRGPLVLPAHAHPCSLCCGTHSECLRGVPGSIAIPWAYPSKNRPRVISGRHVGALFGARNYCGNRSNPPLADQLCSPIDHGVACSEH